MIHTLFTLSPQRLICCWIKFRMPSMIIKNFKDKVWDAFIDKMKYYVKRQKKSYTLFTLLSPQRLICCWIKFRMPSASGSAFSMAGNHLLSFPQFTNHHQYHQTPCGKHHYFRHLYHLNSNYKHFINIIKIVFKIVHRKKSSMSSKFLLTRPKWAR